jgi:hypothetical protein
MPARKSTRATRRKTLAHERGMSAWLLTWEFHAQKPRPARERIALILNPRWTSESVLRVVEVLHHSRFYALSEQAGYANNGRFNPLPAEYAKVGGVRYLGQITCGHHPNLFARLVDKLVIRGAHGEEDVTWQERPLPSLLRT